MRKIREGEMALGAWVNSADQFITEIYATLGCDWVFLDTEHQIMDKQHVAGHILACKGTECTTLVRLPLNSPEHIKWVLDAGAGGVIVPQIASPADASRAVEYTRYHPVGKRGYGGLRCSAFGTDGDYYTRANDEVVVMLQAEDIGFVENLEEILAIDGYDAVFVGPMDLSQSMGHPGAPDHPDVEEAICRIIGACVASGKAVGITGVTEEQFNLRRSQGVTLPVIGSDYRFIRSGLQARLDQCRESMLRDSAAGEQGK